LRTRVLASSLRNRATTTGKPYATRAIKNNFGNAVGKLAKRLASGIALNAERVLAQEYSVKRHRVRHRPLAQLLGSRVDLDALSRPMRWHAGGEFTDPLDESLEVFELRLVLKPALARLAAVRATPLEIARILRPRRRRRRAKERCRFCSTRRWLRPAAHALSSRALCSSCGNVAPDSRVRVQSAVCPAPIASFSGDQENAPSRKNRRARSRARQKRDGDSHLNVVYRVI
jgi:hypothetical protein